jgi:hypothetical protein
MAIGPNSYVRVEHVERLIKDLESERVLQSNENGRASRFVAIEASAGTRVCGVEWTGKGWFVKRQADGRRFGYLRLRIPFRLAAWLGRW